MSKTTNIELGIRRARLFIRDCGDATGTYDPVKGYSRPDSTSYAMVGVAEIDDAAGWKRETMHDFGTLFGSDGGMISFEGAPRSIDSNAGIYDLPGLANDLQFRMPGSIHRALGYGGGGMIMRDTRARSPQGTSLVLILMGLSLPHKSLPDGHMATMTVEHRGIDPRLPGAGRLRIEGPCPLKDRGNGTGLCQILKEPIWGWDAEPHGFMSLMRLDVVDAASRLQTMIVEGSTDVEEMDRLHRITGRSVQSGKDPVYDEFRRRMHAKGMMRPWDHTPTASETIGHEAAVRTLVETLLEKAA